MEYYHHLNVCVDVDAALEYLESCRKEGIVSVPLFRLVASSRVRIRDFNLHLEAIRNCADIRREWKLSELSIALGVSRQTLYNWKESGYLICDPDSGKVDMKLTEGLWNDLKLISKML